MQQLSLDALRSFSGVGEVHTRSPTTALILIDMQNRLVREGGYTDVMLRERGLAEASDQYRSQLAVAIPNARALLERFRATGQPLVHVRPTRLPNRQRSTLSRPIFYQEAPDAWEIIDELAPVAGELVIDKACSGVFAGTNIDFVLRRLGVKSLVFVGCVTDGCVEQAIRQAHDLAYECVLVADATAALTTEIHLNALERLEHRRAHVRTTVELLTADVIPATTIAIPATPTAAG